MHSHLAKMLGQYILESRQEQQILQKELADRLKISPQFLGRIEKGEVMIPDPSLLVAIQVLALDEEKLTKIFRAAATHEISDLLTLSNKKKKKSQKKRA